MSKIQSQKYLQKKVGKFTLMWFFRGWKHVLNASDLKIIGVTLLLLMDVVV